MELSHNQTANLSISFALGEDILSMGVGILMGISDPNILFYSLVVLQIVLLGLSCRIVQLFSNYDNTTTQREVSL